MIKKLKHRAKRRNKNRKVNPRTEWFVDYIFEEYRDYSGQISLRVLAYGKVHPLKVKG